MPCSFVKLRSDADECSRCLRNGEECGAVVEARVRPGGGGIFASAEVDPPPLPMREPGKAGENGESSDSKADPSIAETCRRILSKKTT